MLISSVPMAMAMKLLPAAIIFLLITLSRSYAIGVNYGRIADDLPPPSQVVQLLKAQGITRVKLYDTDADVLSAFSGSGISVTVALPNELLSSAAGNSSSFADEWVQSNILPYSAQIEAVAVGNEVFVDPANTTDFLVPAMENVHAALAKHGLDSSVKVSSPLALTALKTSYPSSSGAFKTELMESVIKPMLGFLNRTGSYLMVNVYPFFAYSADTDSISIDYALFRDESGRNKDPNNGLVYKSLFEAQVDAVYAATAAAGFPDVRVVVSETGWPSKGDQDEAGASLANAAAYNGNLVRRVQTGGGTPLRPKQNMEVFLFALFNEDGKPGPTSERNYGLFYPNGDKVYEMPPLEGVVSGERKAKVGGTWCVANVEAGEERLKTAVKYVCGEGGVDCGAMERRSVTVVGHASFIFNSYYQKNSRRSGSCDFGGAAYVVTQRPNFGTLEFPSGSGGGS